MKDLRLGPGETMLAMERCGLPPEARRLWRGAAAGGAATVLAVVLGLVLASPARWIALCAALATLVTGIVLGWFAFVRAIDGPRLRAVTSERALELTRAEELRAIPLARVAAVKAVRALPDGRRAVAPVQERDAWTGAIGIEIEGRDGRRFEMTHPQMSDVGPAVLRAIAAQAGR